MQQKPKPKIVWEKWVDPFDVKEAEKALNIPDEMDYFSQNDLLTRDELFEEQYLQQRMQYTNLNMMKVIMTPNGIVPITEYNKPSTNFNFWTIHTNFNIGSKVLQAICNTGGIESCDIFSPYRARISIGKAFDEHNVKLDVQMAAIKAHQSRPKKGVLRL